MSETLTQSGFQALLVAPALCEILERSGIIIPTAIQAQAIPPAMQGSDIVGIAQTGTGKTLAFGLPMIARLESGQAGLVIAPTRELAQQIAETYQQLGVNCALVVGGSPMFRQVRDLKARPRVIVATPGRLLDHLNRRTVRLGNVSIVVLDEADRMLDMGFAPDIRRILDQVPAQRQTMLFSATMPNEIAELASQYLKNPTRVEVAPAGTVCELVDQELAYVKHEEKNDVLAKLLSQHPGTVLVFTRTRHGARKLAKTIRYHGHTAAELHSDRTLAQRREALAGFKDGQFRVLVATDIAARGIDVKEIALVVNFDLPGSPEDYLHRIGRTGRAGLLGKAITLALPEQVRDVWGIEKLIGSDLRVSVESTVQAPAPRRAKPEGRNPRGQNPSQRQPRRQENRRPETRKPVVEAAPQQKPAEAAPFRSFSGPSSKPNGHRGWSGRPKRRRMN